jgi:hypothetical protein
MVRSRLILIALSIALGAARAEAQVVVTPYVATNVRTDPGFIDLDDAARRLHGGFGVAVSLVTDRWIGAEVETTFIPSAFSGGDLVESSRLLTASGSVLAVFPARWIVRPYVSAGVGIVQITSEDVARLFVVDAQHPIATVGVGAWAWLGPRIGIRTGIRFVRSLRTVEFGSLETWQPSVGVSLRF